VENLTGHKLPTGYPGRRVWVEVIVEDQEGVVWSSGTVSEDGRIEGPKDPFAIPHQAGIVVDAAAPQVYELVALDTAGAPTSQLTRMAVRSKDNRLLHSAWLPDGPHVAETAPVGIGDDGDFIGGSDRTAYALETPDANGPLTIRARLLFQTVPPHWVDDLRASKAAEATDFVRLYDARSNAPEVLASHQLVLGD